MDKIDAIRSFVEVAKTGSFTAAADNLGHSRIKVSRHVSEVEDWLKLRLLHRTTRRVSLTQPGQEALPLCEQILNATAALESQAQVLHTELVGNIRVAAPIGLGQNLLFDVIKTFACLHPKVRIQLLLSDRMAQLVDERVDVALRYIHQPEENLIARRLLQVDSVVCASPEYLARQGTPSHPNNLSEHNCLTHLDARIWSFVIEGSIQEVSVSGNLDANDANVLLKASLEGMGVALLPLDIAGPYLKRRKLVQILSDYSTMGAAIWAVYLSRSYQQPAVRALIDFIAERWKEGATVPDLPQ
ncbi:LysR family transcriptional regulator [Hahella ganghwensis]|uniref:LysR family transcriptional regulator n=1 Tax=Hahella ganghwensis TaxID=286420 RepID=UPI0003622074|nr:LysR family transcriptional regulator [Hahella ganghwensis]